MGQNRAAKLTQRLKLHPPLSCTRLSSRLLPVTHDMRPNERSPLHKKPPHYLQGSINAASRLEPRIPPDLSVTRWTTRCSSIIVRRTPSEKTSSQKRPGCPRCMNGAASPLKTRHFYHHPPPHLPATPPICYCERSRKRAVGAGSARALSPTTARALCAPCHTSQESRARGHALVY